MTDLDPLWRAVLAILVGGSVAGTVHVAKAKTRLGSSMATLGVANPVLSFVEDVVAFVVAMPKAELDEAEVIAHVKKLITPFKAPSRVIVVGALPKSGVGKILRRELRDMAAEA